LRPVVVYRIGGQTPDERIAYLSFTFDIGLALRPLPMGLSGRMARMSMRSPAAIHN
jgi:hypothetical protein